MTKPKRKYCCNNCGSFTNKWVGQCPDCREWNTIEEELQANDTIIVPNTGTAQQLHYLDGNIKDKIRIITPIEELNLVLGGGIVEGSAILIGGDPGIGKSTLMLQLSSNLSENGIGCLYITGEESVEQIKLRAKRLLISDINTGVVTITNVEDIIATIDQNKKKLNLVIIDSIQTIFTNNIASAPGTVGQIRASTHLLITYAKQNNISLIIACHVNKDGQLAGPKVLEHMVDTVLYFEGDNNNHYRIIRAIKNRFGAVNEIGVFEMTSEGLEQVPNPSEFFLTNYKYSNNGSAIFPAIEGSRPLLVEIQALITPSNMATPRRSVVGWDINRLSMLVAVLAVRMGLNLTAHEIYLNIAGGLKIADPATDLAVIAALISAANNISLPEKSVFFGEIGLSGQIRKVAQSDRRINEAIKLGFKKIYCCKAVQNNKTKALNDNIVDVINLKQFYNILKEI